MPSAEALPYSVKFQGVDDADVLRALQDTSTLHRLRQEAPPDGEGLVRRAEADLRRLSDVLSGYGYYQGRVAIRIDGVPLTGEASVVAAARAAEASRARALVPVKVVVDLGRSTSCAPSRCVTRKAMRSPRRFCPRASRGWTMPCPRAPPRCWPARRRSWIASARSGIPSPRRLPATPWWTTPPTSWTSPTPSIRGRSRDWARSPCAALRPSTPP